MEGPHLAATSNIRLISQLTRPIKELQGYQKSHRPALNRKDGLRYLSEIAQAEIDADLDEKFAALKSAFGFKRREITAAPAELSGLIDTPFFRYRISIDFLGDDLTKVVWLREVEEITEPSQLANPVFLEVFGKQFNSLELNSPSAFPLEEIIDRLEDLESDQISVKYDRELTWCEIGFNPGRAPIRLSGTRLLIHSPLKEVTPLELLESLAEVQRNVIELLDTDIGLPKLNC